MKVLDAIKHANPFSSSGKKNLSSSHMSFDLYYQLAYMATIAAAGVPRDLIFQHAAELDCSSAIYFKRVELARERLKYDYAHACRAIGEPVKNEEVKGLLLRLSSSLISGEPESDFLVREAKARAEDYENEYGRNLEALKLWTDAYVSLILSAVLVVVIGIVSTMIWRIQTPLIIAMAFVSVMTTAIGVWLIWLVSPKEFTNLRAASSSEQKLAARLFKFILPVGVLMSMVFLTAGHNLGYGLIVLAALSYPIGHVVNRDSRKVTKRDAEVGTFLRSLGGVCNALGTTVSAALSRIDMEAINVLRDSVRNLHTRLTAGIRTRLSWNRFVEETGSELTRRSVGMFYDAIEVGGSAGQAGQQASAYADRVALLRARRRTVSGPFRWLCITMHTAVVVILVFITEVITRFGGMVSTAQQNLPSTGGTPSMGSLTTFNLSGLQLMHSMVVPLVLVFTVANSIVPVVADGGSKYKILGNFAIMGAISGFALIVLPILSSALFSSVAHI